MLSYEIVDVFTDRAFSGNPLAVVLDGESLTTGQMQQLANEFHLSETAFPLASQRADYRLRIFTPSTELPFAGHPSIGAADTLARLSRLGPGRVVQECGAGLLPIHIGDTHLGQPMITLTGGEPTLGPQLDPRPLLAAVGLNGDDFAGPPPRLAGCGIAFAHLAVRADALPRAVPNAALLALLGAESGVSVSAWDPTSRTAHCRVFAAEVGVTEDPATGSAALGYGVWLVAGGLVDPEGATEFTVRQGIEMGRPSTLHCGVEAAGGRAVRATVAGTAVPVASGEICEP